MFFNNSPMESLAAFSIVLVSGALAAIGLIKYIDWVRMKAAGASQVNFD